VTLWKGSTLVLAGSTDGYTETSQVSCYANSGPNRIYAIRPTADGFATIDAVFAGGFNALVDIRDDDCASETAKVLCEDTLSIAFQRVVEMKADHTYYIIVEGDGPDSRGAFDIRLQL
jgi:hypothetical protein